MTKTLTSQPPVDQVTQWKTSIRIRMIKDLASMGGVDRHDYQDMQPEDFFAAIGQVFPEYKGKIGK